MDTIGWIKTLWQDARYAFRMLHKNPGFTSVAVITLALGIGANTTIFSVTNALMLRPLRLTDPDKLVYISETRLKQRGSRIPTMAAYFAWRKNSRALEDLAIGGYGGGDPITLSGVGHAERVMETYCGLNFFDMLGVRPIRGRTFLPEDNPQGLSTTALISRDLWQRAFASDPKILGQTVMIGGEKKTIIGILPPGFSVGPWKIDLDVWLAYDPAAGDVDVAALATKVLKARKGEAYGYAAMLIAQCQTAAELPATIREILEAIHKTLSAMPEDIAAAPGDFEDPLG